MIVQRYILGLALLGLMVAACGATEADERISPTLPAQRAVNEGSPSSLEIWPPSGAEDRDRAVVEDVTSSSPVPTLGSTPTDTPTSTRDSIPQADPLLDVGNAAPKLASMGYEVGDLAPAFVLPSSGGPPQSLEMFREDKNIILVIYYAFW